MRYMKRWARDKSPWLRLLLIDEIPDIPLEDKSNMFALLGRPGYEEKTAELNSRL